MQLQRNLLDRMSFNNKLPSLQSVFSKNGILICMFKAKLQNNRPEMAKKIDQRGKYVSAVIIFCRTYQHFIVYIAAECQQYPNL